MLAVLLTNHLSSNVLFGAVLAPTTRRSRGRRFDSNTSRQQPSRLVSLRPQMATDETYHYTAGTHGARINPTL